MEIVNSMKILAIESSCDETSAAVVEKIEDKIIVYSNVTATSLSIHAKTGGIIPENAAREQVKYIIPVIKEAIFRSQFTVHSIDAIAVTYGPGLIGSLLVGVETAKTLSYVYDKPLIPVNHLLAHIFANFIENEATGYPFIGLIVSGGHTDLLYFKSIDKFKWLGGTRDDAAGEALDKIGRLLGLSYPAGAEIEKRARIFLKSQGADTLPHRRWNRSYTSGKRQGISFKSPLFGEDTFDFSFSGLKTEVMRYIINRSAGGTGGRDPDTRAVKRKRASTGGKENPGQDPRNLSEQEINEICFAVQKAVIDVLVKKTLAAAQKYNCSSILLGGGVSANNTLRNKFELEVSSQNLDVNIFSPEKIYCTDNAAMIGAYALLNPIEIPWQKLSANPNLYFA